MNKMLAGIVIASFCAAALPVFAQGMMGNSFLPASSAGTNASPDVNASLQEIAASQKVGNVSQINCQNVTDDQFEKLGDAVMGSGISSQQHAAMETMMGGEGSATLRQAHITMGRSYLGCWASYNSGPVWMPMMGYGSWNPYGYRGGMMGNWDADGYGVGGYGWMAWVTMVLFWVLLALGIAAAVKWLRKK